MVNENAAIKNFALLIYICLRHAHFLLAVKQIFLDILLQVNFSELKLVQVTLYASINFHIWGKGGGETNYAKVCYSVT